MGEPVTANSTLPADRLASLRSLTKSVAWEVEVAGLPAYACVALSKATLIQLLDVSDLCAAEHILRVQTEKERVETARQAARLLNENLRLREALADIARGDYSDPLCQRTPEQRARDALAHKP